MLSWSARPPSGSRSSRGSRRSKARPGITRSWSVTSCWFATARRWRRSGCPSRAPDEAGRRTPATDRERSHLTFRLPGKFPANDTSPGWLATTRSCGFRGRRFPRSIGSPLLSQEDCRPAMCRCGPPLSLAPVAHVSTTQWRWIKSTGDVCLSSGDHPADWRPKRPNRGVSRPPYGTSLPTCQTSVSARGRGVVPSISVKPYSIARPAATNAFPV